VLGQSRLERCRRMLSGQSCSDTLVPVPGSSSGQELDEQAGNIAEEQEQLGHMLAELEQELAGNIAEEQEQPGMAVEQDVAS